MKAVILAVGDELTAGATVDTNSAFLSRRLAEHGIATLRHLTVGDDTGAIARALAEAAAEAGLVVVSGGLGPTADDLTRHALAEATGAELVEDARSAERIAAFFALRGRQMKPSNRRQALAPAGAEMIDNDCGTAPGIAARIGRAEVFALPGPPHEMVAMFEARVLPRLRGDGAIARRELHTFGTGESDVAAEIADLMARDANPTVGTTAKAGVITVRIAATAPTAEAAEALADGTAAEVRRRLGELVFGAGEETMASVVGALLDAAGRTAAAAESCTGGLVSEMITGVPGASRYFRGGVVAYANAAKTDLLGVPAERIAAAGAVSEPVAEALAAGAARRFGADYGLSLTGIAGPAGGSDDKPVGLVYIGLASPAGTAVHRHVFPGTRDVIRRRAALAALNHLRLALAHPQGPPRQ